MQLVGFFFFPGVISGNSTKHDLGMRKYKGKRTLKMRSLGLYFLFIVIPQQEI